ncbi:hypothetical protein [Variovorax sp. YR566]|uniref:hypothetical protein n=1 Tax=Variovorax sp. YR566 TaxID=3450237 RepID=UPI003F81D556
MTASRAPAAARDVDVRGFAYPLEPIRQREQWRLDRLMAELARAQQAILETEAEMTRLQHAHDQQATAMAQALPLRLDASAHRRALGYLAHLRGQWQQLDVRHEAQCVERDRLRQQCVAQQVRLDGLARHKEDALTAYADEIRHRDRNEQDRDWLARSSFARPMLEAE